MSDLISRQAALAEFVDGRDVYDITESIESLPSADRPTVDKEYLIDLIQEAVYDGEACAKLMDMVDRPTGEWIEDGYCDRNCVCSHCGGSSGTQFDGVQPIPLKTKFCPNCGARMIGEEK